MNIYEAILRGAPSTDAELQAAAARLRGQDDRAVLAMLSGDRVLAPVGEMQMRSVQGQAQGLSRTRQAMLDRQAKASQHEREQARLEKSAEEQRKLMEKVYGMQHAAAMAQLAESQRYHDLQLNQDNLQHELALSKLDAAERQKLNNATRQLAFKLQDEGVTDLETAIEMADKEMSKYIDVDTGERVEGVGDIPGYGAAANVLPMAALSKEGKDLRTAMAKVRNLILKARSGAAVTDPEMMRLAEELGAALGGTEDQVIQAYVGLKKAFRHVKIGIESGFDPSVVEEYGRRFRAREMYPGAGANLPPVQPAAPSALPKTRRGTAVEIIQ